MLEGQVVNEIPEMVELFATVLAAVNYRWEYSLVVKREMDNRRSIGVTNFVPPRQSRAPASSSLRPS